MTRCPINGKEEIKLIVCRTTGRPLIFPNVIEGVYTYFEKQSKKKKKKREKEKRGRKLESIGEKGEECGWTRAEG